MTRVRTSDSVEAALRAARPPRVVLVVDGVERELALRAGNGKWAHVTETARKLAGAASSAVIEMRDADGHILGALSLHDDDDDSDDATSEPEPVPLAAPDARDERMLSLLLSAQRAALEEQRILLQPVLDSYQQLARGYAEFAAQVVQLVSLASQVREATESTSAASSAADAALVQMVSQLGAKKAGA